MKKIMFIVAALIITISQISFATTSITTRAGKGSALTWAEMDGNFINLRNAHDNAAGVFAQQIAALQAGQSGGTIGYVNKATMDADLAPDAGSIALVSNDPDMANNVNWIKIGASGTGSWQKSNIHVQPFIDISLYGNNLEAAVLGIGDTPTTLVYGVNLEIHSDLEIPETLELMPLNGAFINYSTHTLTYDGPTERWPLRPIFQGMTSGRVLGLKESKPEWFGATTSGENTDACQAAIYSATKKVHLEQIYPIARGLKVATNDLEIEGQGGFEQTSATGVFATLALVENTTGAYWHDFTLKGNTSTEPAGPAPMRAIVLGTNAAGTAHSAVSWSAKARLHNLKITGYSDRGFNLGIQVNKANDSVIDSNKIDALYGVNSSFGYGIVCNGENVDLDNNRIKSTITGQGRHAIYLTNTPKNVRATNNYAEGFQDEAFTSNTSTTPGDSYGLHYRYNTAYNCLLTATGAGAANFNISSGSPKSSIIGNKVLGTQGSNRNGIVCAAGNSIVADNYVENTMQDAYWLYTSDGTIFTGNTAKDFDLETGTTYSGLKIFMTSNALINGNTFAATAARSAIAFNLSAPVGTNNKLGPNNLSGTYGTALIENAPTGLSWTPVLLFGGGNSGMTGTFTGKYDIKDNKVFVKGSIILTAKGGSTGNATIAGLPIPASGNLITTIRSLFASGMTFTTAPIIYATTSATSLSIGLTSASGGNITNATDANFTNTSQLYIEFDYEM